MTRAVLLLSERDRREARELIASQGFRYEADAEEIAGLYEDGRLVATGARAGYVLKMLAIAPSHRDGAALGELIGLLFERARSAGHKTVFIFTRADNVASFERLNFRVLLVHGGAALLECGPGFPAYLKAHRALKHRGRNGAIVLNGNPFTLGHLHLAEQSAREVDRLYLFIVRDDRLVFPFPVRLRLATEATAHIGNISVLDTSRYAVSAGTFPSYFVKRAEDAAALQAQFDLRLFAALLAPAFSVRIRFVSDEPDCASSRTMRDVLAEHGIECVHIARRAEAGEPISAARVRDAFRQRDFERIAAWVPPATMKFLRSAEGADIARRLAESRKGK